MEFITTVAETFNIPDDEYIQIRDFILLTFKEVPHSEEIMVIDGKEDFKDEETKHLC